VAHVDFSIRDAVVAAVSCAVLGILVLYALAGPTAKLRADFGPVVPRPGATAIVQGRILDSGGGGLDGARILVARRGRAVGRALTDGGGTFRIDVPGNCGVYRISVQAHAAGSNVDTAARRQLCPGDALPVDAHIETQGHFIWIPGPR
jgi:hypothetical protein